MLGEDNRLIITNVPFADAEETVILKQNGTTLSQVVFHNPGGPVYALLAEPEQPVAAVVFVPGAGVSLDAHRERAMSYAASGIAFCAVDPRGNGDMTPGYAFDIEKDFTLFSAGKWPQVYRVAADLMIIRGWLADRSGVPVYAAGSSMGGRYSVLAAAADQGFAGWFGVSTSGFMGAGSEFTGDSRRFIESIDPDYAVARIAPRPVRVYHAADDTVIPFDAGMALFNHAREPKDFAAFNGTHGINAEVDAMVMADVLTFNAREHE